MTNRKELRISVHRVHWPTMSTNVPISIRCSHMYRNTTAIASGFPCGLLSSSSRRSLRLQKRAHHLDIPNCVTRHHRAAGIFDYSANLPSYPLTIPRRCPTRPQSSTPSVIFSTSSIFPLSQKQNISHCRRQQRHQQFLRDYSGAERSYWHSWICLQWYRSGLPWRKNWTGNIGLSCTGYSHFSTNQLRCCIAEWFLGLLSDVGTQIRAYSIQTFIQNSKKLRLAPSSGLHDVGL